MTRRLFTYAVLAAALPLLAPSASADDAKQAKKKAKVLFLTQSKGFKHGSVNRRKDLAPAEIAMVQLGEQTGLFECHCSQDSKADFTKENLAKYDVVMFYTTGVLDIDEETREYFLNDWLKQEGHGWIGFHSAADTYRTKNPDHSWYWELCGGTFNGHPWGSGSKVTITVHDPEHPTMKPYGAEFEFTDEIYQYVNWNADNVRVLMSLNMAKTSTKKPYHVPVAWCRSWGEGKVFFNNLGHREDTWTNEAFLKSTENAVRWALGEVEGSSKVNPDVSAKWDAKSKADAGG